MPKARASTTGRHGLVCGVRALAAVAMGALLGAPATAQELNSRIEGLLSIAKLGDATVGISVIDVSSGRVLAARNAGTAMLPASNMKLLTSGTALLVLGEGFSFRTELALDGTRLIVRGAGDPALGDPAMLERSEPPMSVDGLLGALAAGVTKAGVSSLSQIIVDDRVFDRDFVHPGWPKDQLDRWYCAEVAGVSFHTNVLSVFPAPSREGAGRPPTVTLEPEAPWLEIENRGRTVGDGNNSVWLTRLSDDNRFRLSGDVRFPARAPVEVTLHDNGSFFGRLLAVRLARSGVAVGASAGSEDPVAGAVSAVRGVNPGEDLPAGRTVAVVTTALRDVVWRCNTDSQNLYAECLLKRIGHEVTHEPGSWASGSSVVRMTISQRLGPELAASTVVSDGSGLSRDNRVAPLTLTRWLALMAGAESVGDEFMASLATPEKGNLKRRFGDARLQNDLAAKSGSIDGVRCLSGYLTDAETQRSVAFSILVNDLRPGEASTNALKFHEEVVRALDRWLSQQKRPANAAVPDR